MISGPAGSGKELAARTLNRLQTSSYKLRGGFAEECVRIVQMVAVCSKDFAEKVWPKLSPRIRV